MQRGYSEQEKCIGCQRRIGQLAISQSLDLGPEEVDGRVLCEDCLQWQCGSQDRLLKEIACLQAMLCQSHESNLLESAKQGEEWDEQQMQEEIDALMARVDNNKATLLHHQTTHTTLANSYLSQLQLQSSLNSAISRAHSRLHLQHSSIQHLSHSVSKYSQQLDELNVSEPLVQLYPIYCDNNWAYIDGEAITWETLHSLLQIVTLLAHRHNYIHWQYDPGLCQINHRGQCEVYRPESQRKTIPVLHLITSAVSQLWEEVRLSMGCQLRMPFEVVVEPVVTVQGMAFSNSSSYPHALRHLVSNVKFIMEVPLRLATALPALKKKEG